MASGSAARATRPAPVAPPPDAPAPAPAAAAAISPHAAAPSLEAPAAAEPASSGEPDPAWPDESAESQFLAEARERGEPVPVPAITAAEPESAEPEPAGPAPELDDLVARLPPAVRETLDELFRARFVRVTRLPRKALTTAKG